MPEESSPPSPESAPSSPPPAESPSAPAAPGGGFVATLRRHPRISIAVAAAAALALVIGVSVGVASALNRPPVASAPASDTDVEEEPAPEPEPAPTTTATIPIVTGQTLLRENDRYSAGPLSAVVWSPRDQSESDPSGAGTPDLRFQTLLIEPTVPVSALNAWWTAPDGTVLGDFAFSAQLDGDSPAGFAGVATVTTPASGLQAESSTYSVALWSAAGEPTSESEITSPCTEECWVGQAWYSGDTIVVQWNISGRITPLVVQAVSASSGATLWSAPLDVVDAVGSTLVAVTEEESSLLGVDMSTGSTVWTYAPPFDGTYQMNYLGYLGGNNRTNELVIAGSTGRVVIAREGSPPNTCLCTYFSNMVYDANTDVVIVQARAPEGGGFYMEVVNAADGSSVFVLPPDQLAALDTPPLVAALDGAGWIRTRSGYDLFVATTGAQDPRASSVESTRFVPKWTTGSISLLGGSLLVAHQGQPLTIELLVQLTGGE
jgi:hypothetical protein